MNLKSVLIISLLINSATCFAQGEATPNPDGTMTWRGQRIAAPNLGPVNMGGGAPGMGHFGGNQVYSGVPQRTAPVQTPAPEPVRVPTPAPIAVITYAQPTQVQNLTAKYTLLIRDPNRPETAIAAFEAAQTEFNAIPQEQRTPALLAERERAIADINRRYPDWNNALAHAQQRREQVAALGRTVDDNLRNPEFTRRVSPEGQEYVRRQRTDIEQLARRARDIVTNSRAYFYAAYIVSDYAYHTMQSMVVVTTHIIGGFYQGYADTVIGVAQLTQFLAENPEEFNHISTHIMNYVSSGRIIDASRRRLHEIHMAIQRSDYATSGRLIGHLGWDIIPAVRPVHFLMDTAAQTTRAVVNEMAVTIGERSLRQQAFGTMLYQRLSAHPHLSQEIARIQTQHGVYTPLNPGPLAQISASTEQTVAQGGPSIAGTFRSATYVRDAVQAETMDIWRFNNRRLIPNIDGVDPQIPRFYSRAPMPQAQIQPFVDNAIAPQWNQGNFLIHMRVPRENIFYRGLAAPVNGAGTGITADLVGGGEQIFIEHPRFEWIVEQTEFRRLPQ